MTVSGDMHDPIFAALDPLVRDATLSPDQANELYRAVVRAGTTASPSTAPGVQPPAVISVPAPSVPDVRRPAGWTRPAAGAGLGTVGLGLLASAYAISFLLAVDDFGWNTFLGMVAPIVVASLVVVASEIAPGEDELRTLAAVAGSLAIVGLALTIWATGDSGSLSYVGGLVMLLGGLAGYLAWHRQVFVVPAVLGGLVLVTKLAADVLGITLRQQDNDALFFGMLVALYGVVVVLVGWRSSCRHLAGVLGDVVALGSLAIVILVNGFTGTFSVEPDGRIETSYRSDTVIALVAALLVCIGLAAAYAVSREAGFLTVAALGAAALPALAGPFLTQKHPLQVAAIFGFVGIVVAAAGLVLAWRRPAGAPAGRQAA